MQITLIPQRRDDTLRVTRQGDTLTINGEAFDFSVIPEGATLPANATDCPFLTGNIERIAGVLRVSLLLPTGPNASHAANFPEPIINPADGVLELPA